MTRSLLARATNQFHPSSSEYVCAVCPSEWPIGTTRPVTLAMTFVPGWPWKIRTPRGRGGPPTAGPRRTLPPTFVQVVPRGLRAFDKQDAEAFLHLLPGPRGRDGLPESICFWKARIEDREGDPASGVGLVYGPSGCGKSSLVKAGLLPRLENSVVSVFVEATPADTDAGSVPPWWQKARDSLTNCPFPNCWLQSDAARALAPTGNCSSWSTSLNNGFRRTTYRKHRTGSCASPM